MNTEGIVYAGFITILSDLKNKFTQLYGDDAARLVSDFSNSSFQNVMLSFGMPLSKLDKEESPNDVANIIKINQMIEDPSTPKEVMKEILTVHSQMLADYKRSEKSKAKKLKNAAKAALATHSFFREFYNNNIFCDSGGYQVAVDCIDQRHVPGLVHSYCEFIDSVKDDKTFYFIEDILPTEQHKIPTPQIAADLTIYGLKTMSKLPAEKKKNIYFVYHFQRSDVFRLWCNILDDADPVDLLGSHRWAVGGIVSSGATSLDDKFITYMYPAVDIIQREMAYLKTGGHIYLHVLGVTGLTDIFFYALFQTFMNFYGLNIHVTFDSTSAIQSIVRGRFIYAWEKTADAFYKIPLNPEAYLNGPGRDGRWSHSANISVRKNPEEYLEEVLTHMSNKYHFPIISNLYDRDMSNQNPERFQARLVSQNSRHLMSWQALTLCEMYDWSICKSEQIVKEFTGDFDTALRENIFECVRAIRGEKIIANSRSDQKITAMMNTLEVFHDIIINGSTEYNKRWIFHRINDKLEVVAARAMKSDNVY